MNQEAQKIKKKEETLTLELVKNPDILRWASENRNNEQKVIGFALETTHEEEYAQAKLQKKNFDYIVLNSLREEGAGFGHDTNKVIIFGKDNKKLDLPLMSKNEVAKAIFNFVHP